jgi:hypothetical protein
MEKILSSIEYGSTAKTQSQREYFTSYPDQYVPKIGPIIEFNALQAVII